MNIQSFKLNIKILKSNHIDYQENKFKKITIKKKIGEGSYGLVFLIENDFVIKIFKNSTETNTILNESNYLIPIKNENRELIFFYKYINHKLKKNYIINLNAIGVTKDILVDKDNVYELNSYFIILPLCIPFYEIFNILNIPLIDKKDGITFTISVMKRLIEISYFIENKYNIVNLDFKLNNFMFKKKSNSLNDLIMIDFSIIKKNNGKNIFDYDNSYYIWPNTSKQIIDIIPSYSICINGLELLFGRNEILELLNDNKIKELLKIIELKNKNIYTIFYNGLILKINTKNFLNLINKIFIH